MGTYFYGAFFPSDLILAHLAFAAAEILAFAVSLMVLLTGFTSTGGWTSATGIDVCATGGDCAIAF